MAQVEDKNPENVEGAFYVDEHELALCYGSIRRMPC
jgi:hypothetical protein